MSVTSLLEFLDVCKQLDRLVPTFPRRIAAPLVAPPATRSYALIGTAFDYALRFELERRYPHVRTKRWVAEAALDKLLDVDRLLSLPEPAEIMAAWSTAETAKTIVERARCEVGAYIKNLAPSTEARVTMAEHAIRLAKLDAVYRANYVDPRMDIVEPGNVEDVLRLLDVVPYEALAHPTILWLNPTFGRYSELVDGADCDLISGDRLIDIKVTKNNAIQKEYMRQLVSYAILQLGARGDDPVWPDVRHIGIYFARHGHLWTVPVDTIFANPAYAEVEAWYFERAAKEFNTTLTNLTVSDLNQ